MVSIEKFREIVREFPEVEEAPHFDKEAFKIKKKIFVTLNQKETRCCLKLSPEDQATFALFDANVIYPVPNKWGKQGWTLVNLDKVEEEMLIDILTQGFCHVAPEKISKKVMDEFLRKNKI